MSLTTGTGEAGYKNTIIIEIRTEAEAEPRGMEERDVFRETPYGWKVESGQIFDPPNFGSDRVLVRTGLGYLDPGIGLNLKSNADGPVDIYLWDDLVETIKPGEATSLYLGWKTWQKVAVPLGVIGVGAVVTKGLDWW